MLVAGAGAYVVGDAQRGNGSAKPEPLANVLVELSSGDEVLRRTTDARGRFLFDCLRPGTWRLKVHEMSLPPLHDAHPNDVTLELAAGDDKRVDVTVVPRQREIKMLEKDDEVIQEAPQGEERN